MEKGEDKMKRKELVIALLLVASLVGTACSNGNTQEKKTTDENKSKIEKSLDLSNIKDQNWTYSSDADAWTLESVTAVTDPEMEEEQGVSVCVPGAYAKGIDTDGDGKADVTADSVSDSVTGFLVVDHDGKITSTNGQEYTADTAPVIVNTGAAGYSEQQNQNAATTYAAEGYMNVSCGNRGKQSSITDKDGNTVYTGDAPCCLVDQKNAVRFVKYNILLGNLPGNVDYFVSTGGSGGGAHATMLAATSGNADFYPYEAAAGAVGIYENKDGSFSNSVTIDGKEVEISDGMWGCMAYSAITSLAEADMALGFEYFLDSQYTFNTSFQKKMAEFLSEEYMDYINDKKLSVEESKVGLDVNEDGDTKDTVELTIQRDLDKYPDTNGYYGTYLNLYLHTFEASLESYLARLNYAEGWTWFDKSGKVLSDSQIAKFSLEDKAQAFLEGRYVKTSSGEGAGGPGNMNFGNGEKPDGMPEGEKPDGMPNGEVPDSNQTEMTGNQEKKADQTNSDEGTTEKVGTPDQGTTQASGSSTDSANYASYEELVNAYKEDIAAIEKGDVYGNNIVELYDPIRYIGGEGTQNPTWSRILCGASEGDISMFNSLNLQVAWLGVGTDAKIEWQWDGGHVPSEILGDSLSLYVDQMYGKYVEGAATIKKKEAEKQTTNGTETEATGADRSDWITYQDGKVTFSLADVATYRTSGASKAMPAFDVMDYGQEDYEFGSESADARHWDNYVLKVLQNKKDELEDLFNTGK